MDVREKLVEICFHEFCMVAGDSPCGCDGCPYGKYGSDDGLCYEEYKKDKLENLEKTGVTVQEWISVKDRLPKNDYGKHWKERKYYLVRFAPSGLMCVAHYGYKEYDWWIDEHDCVLSATNFKEVTHWMEINNLPPTVERRIIVDCNCKDCPYRIAVARIFDVHIWKEDCDKYGTEYCKKQIPPKGE